MAKMDPSAADMALAVWNGYVQDARRHARNFVKFCTQCVKLSLGLSKWTQVPCLTSAQLRLHNYGSTYTFAVLTSLFVGASWARGTNRG